MVATENTMAKEVAKYVLSPIRIEHGKYLKSAVGSVEFVDLEQYITDKLCIYMDEFLINFTEDDIKTVCSLTSLAAIDRFFRTAFDRCYMQEGA